MKPNFLDHAMITFSGSRDLLYLAIIIGGMLALAAPDSAPLFLAAVGTGWVISRTPGVAPTDRQDAHER